MNPTTFDAATKTWKGPQNSRIFNSKAGLGELLLSVLARTPNKVAQISDNNGVTFTCKEIRERSIRVAENLKLRGYKFGDMMAIISRNNHDVSAVVFGCHILGAPLNCLDPTFGEADLYGMLNLTRPKVVFCETFNLETVKNALKSASLNAEVILLGETLEGQDHVTSLLQKVDGVIEKHYIPTKIEQPETHPVVIVCSSGTTGQSKGVCLSHSHIIVQAEQFGDLCEEDTLLCFSSIYWVSGYMTLVMGTLVGSQRIITTEPYSPATMCRIVEKYKTTATISPPSQISQLLGYENVDKCDLSSIRQCLCGGSFVSDNLRKQMQKRINGDVIVGYGMTEAGGLCTMTYPDIKLGCVGGLVKGMQAKIVDPDTETKLGPGEIGEIRFKYEFDFLGYFGNEKSTKEAFDKDGWICSGDIGFFDESCNLHIVDRKKDIIKYNNYQISPSEIEAVLQQETGILNMCVVGIEDIEHGTDLPAVVVLKDKSLNITEEDIIKTAERTLPNYKHLRGGCYFVDEFPMTPSGKVQRRVVKEMAKKFYMNHDPNVKT
ncbi:probable 4-coumarate--CoA ligase 1 [Culicoides brevitarsis]|uniref:probable 4-coumarate--CoA ligase 1 n=1 Tax=Culicoides brevitarsis TaxID=469753 RepID=UPI00307B11D6